MNHDFRLLKAEEIDVRVGQVSKGRASLLLYKDARCDMAILDEVYDGRWQRDHKEVKGNMYAGVGVWDPELMQWIWRWDCGTESYTEKEKGEASDAFKRACVNLGIGRELYTAPPIWVDAETEADGKTQKLKDKFQFSGCRVSSISYSKDRKISGLDIVDKKGKNIYHFGKKSAAKKDELPPEATSHDTSRNTNTDVITTAQANEIRDLAERANVSTTVICKRYGECVNIESMPAVYYEGCIKKLKATINSKENKE